MNKNEKLRLAAVEFAEKAQKLLSVLEIAIVGSVAGNDPYPNDLDLVIIVRNLDEIANMAKYARQISSHYHNWDVFLFDESLIPLDRVCHRKECPAQSIDCSVPGCGKTSHVMLIPDFEYNENMFFKSPIEVLWTSFNMSRFLAHKVDLGITKVKRYPVLEDIEIECIFCGKTFVFTGGEQKWYQKRGLYQPKRCLDCREHIDI